MTLLPRVFLLCGILTIAACQTRRTASGRNRNAATEGQGRTLGLLSPLLTLGLGGLADPYYGVPIRPVSSGGSSSEAQSDGVQSDPSYGGAGYPNYGYNGGGGYRPNYSAYGYAYPGFGYQYPYYNRPNYNYGGIYQRPQPVYRPINYPVYPYPGGYQPAYNNYGGYQRPSNSNFGGVISSPTGVSAAATSSAINSGLGGGGTPASSSANSAQAAQVAALLGQALGSSLRPLLANGAGSSAAAGGNANALSGLLNLLG